jgi:very-short-patch-repair endonuclease
MPARRDPAPRLLRFARVMRHTPTEAELKLWSLLRDRRLGGFKFRRQHPVGGYILDFFCEATTTAVELDGSQHTTPEGIAYDQKRTADLANLRIRVLRFSDHETLKDPIAVARTILRILTTGE